VSERPGTTRDRHFGDAEWQGRRFWVVDTGGLVPGSDDSMDRAIARQVEFALDESDVVVFLVDGKEGVHPVDQAIAERLRRARRPVVLAVNKLDDLERSSAHLEFYELGVGRYEASPLRSRRVGGHDRRGGGGSSQRGQVVTGEPAARRGAPRGCG
jgi:GTP-binding protein